MAEGSAACPIDLTDDDSLDNHFGVIKRVGEEISNDSDEDSSEQNSAKRTKKDEKAKFEGISGDLDSVEGTLFSTVSEQILEYFSENGDADSSLLPLENWQGRQNQASNKPNNGAQQSTAQTSTTSEAHEAPEFIDIDQLQAGPSHQKKFESGGIVSQPHSTKNSDCENIQGPIELQTSEKIENVQEPLEEQTNEKIENFQEQTNSEIENLPGPLEEQTNEKNENNIKCIEELNNEKKAEVENTAQVTETSEEQHINKHGELKNSSLPSVDSNEAATSLE